MVVGSKRGINGLFVAWAAFGFIVTTAVPLTAVGQTIDTYYLMPLPGGTNAAEVSGSYTHFDGLNFSNGNSVPNTTLDVYTATLRLAHYVDVRGYTAGFQIFQPVSYLADFKPGGINLDSTSGMHKLGAANTTLSAFIWPYANVAEQAYVFTAAYLTPPDGSYAPGQTFNAAYGGWAGDAQFGVVKGFGAQLSLQAAFDTDLHGREQLSAGGQRSVNPIYRIQVWTNWDWTSAFRTSVGFTSSFGGALTDHFNGIRFDLARNSEYQRLRAAASYSWTPGILTSVEVAHDVETGGGYQLGAGATGKIRILF